MKTLVLFVFFCVLCCPLPVAAGITAYPALNAAAFWQKNFSGGNELVLDAGGVKALNEKIVDISPAVYSMAQYPSTVSGAFVKNWINENAWLLKEDFYVKKAPMTAAYRQLITNEINMDTLAGPVTVRYAVTVCRVNLRAMPTNEGWFYSPGDSHFDQLQNTALDPAEPVAILHQSKSGNFFFVQMRNYRGWLPAWTVGLATRPDWLKYVQPKDFLVVTANKIVLKEDPRQNLYQMGARIPIESVGKEGYAALLPSRGLSGALQGQAVNLPVDTSRYNRGYLPYTRHNILEQAFKFLNDPYGWGGLVDSVDCSAFIANIYRSVGVELPRDADQQEEEATGVRLMLKGLSNAERAAMFSGIQPGDVLFMPGHTLLYLGQTQNTLYAIHALGSHYVNGQKTRVMRVVVSDLDLWLASGHTHFEALSSAMSYR